MRHTGLLVALLACAPARKPLGELAVFPVNQLLPQRQIAEALIFRVESARIVIAPAMLDLIATEDACLRGESLGHVLYLCPAPAEDGDAKGLYRWRSVNGMILGFSIRLLDYGDTLRVDANLHTAEFPLPKGPAGDEIRRHPELLGAAFALGIMPPSSDPDLWAYQITAR